MERARAVRWLLLLASLATIGTIGVASRAARAAVAQKAGSRSSELSLNRWGPKTSMRATGEAISIAGQNISCQPGGACTSTTATFSNNLGLPCSSYSSTVTSTGNPAITNVTITPNAMGGCDVIATFTYASPGTFTVTTVVSSNSSSGLVAPVTSAATVAIPSPTSVATAEASPTATVAGTAVTPTPVTPTATAPTTAAPTAVQPTPSPASTWTPVPATTAGAQTSTPIPLTVTTGGSGAPGATASATPAPASPSPTRPPSPTRTAAASNAPVVAIDRVAILHSVRGKVTEVASVRLGQRVTFVVVYHALAASARPIASLSLTKDGRPLGTYHMFPSTYLGRQDFRRQIRLSDALSLGKLYAHFTLVLDGARVKRDRRFYLVR